MNKHILFVEDNEVMIALWNHQLHGVTGITTTFCRTSAAAKNVLQNIKFDIVFLDGTLNHEKKYDTVPETALLYQSFSDKLPGTKFFSTTDYQRHQKYMEGLGVTHIAKENAIETLKAFFMRPTLEKRKRTFYELKPGLSLVVVRIDNLETCIVKISNHNPHRLMIDAITSLKPGDYKILEVESCLIQGSEDEQSYLFATYLQAGIKIRSTLKSKAEC